MEASPNRHSGFYITVRRVWRLMLERGARRCKRGAGGWGIHDRVHRGPRRAMEKRGSATGEMPAHRWFSAEAIDGLGVPGRRLFFSTPVVARICLQNVGRTLQGTIGFCSRYFCRQDLHRSCRRRNRAGYSPAEQSLRNTFSKDLFATSSMGDCA